MSTVGIDQMLGQLRAMSALAAGDNSAAPAAEGSPDFAQVLKTSVAQVNKPNWMHKAYNSSLN